MVLTFKIGFTLVVVGVVALLCYEAGAAVGHGEGIGVILTVLAQGVAILGYCMLRAVWFPEKPEGFR